MANDTRTDRVCPRDGFPMVKIGGRWQCAAEHLDRCIGGQRIREVRQQARTVYYVFEDGHELPLLCFCCGEPLACGDLEKSRCKMRGRRLEAMAVRPIEMKDGRQIPRFELEFSGKGLSPGKVYEPLSSPVVARLRHPPECRRRKRQRV
jgi:hypothetical protein